MNWEFLALLFSLGVAFWQAKNHLFAAGLYAVMLAAWLSGRTVMVLGLAVPAVIVAMLLSLGLAWTTPQLRGQKLRGLRPWARSLLTLSRIIVHLWYIDDLFYVATRTPMDLRAPGSEAPLAAGVGYALLYPLCLAILLSGLMLIDDFFRLRRLRR